MDTAQFVYRQGAGLAHFDPKFTGDFGGEQEARARLSEAADAIAKYQDILMAHGDYGLIILFQGMDGAGKDATCPAPLTLYSGADSTARRYKEQHGRLHF